MRYDPATGACLVHRENSNYANGLTFDAAKPLVRLRRRRDSRRPPRRPLRARRQRQNPRRQLRGQALQYPQRSGGRPPGSRLVHRSVLRRIGRAVELRSQIQGARSRFRLSPRSAAWRDSYSITRVTFDTTRPNGLLFSLDYQNSDVAQSGREPTEKRQLRAYPVRPDMAFGSARHPARFRRESRNRRHAPRRGRQHRRHRRMGTGRSRPDDLRLLPSGAVLETHPVPCRRPTNCSFGGDDLTTLYVTTIEGFLFRTRTDRCGIGFSLFGKRVPSNRP